MSTYRPAFLIVCITTAVIGAAYSQRTIEVDTRVRVPVEILNCECTCPPLPAWLTSTRLQWMGDLIGCMGGPDAPPEPRAPAWPYETQIVLWVDYGQTAILVNCAKYDSNKDGHVDLRDFADMTRN